jgi:DmsE family decaheme c-type cytochrome
MALSAMTAKAVAANSDDASFSALRDFVQSVATTPNGTDAQNSGRDVSKATAREPGDSAYAALRNFARRIGDKQSPSIKSATILAQANSLFEFLQKGGSASQSGPMNSNGPVAGGKNPSAPVAARYVGAKVCMTCHADRAAAFGKTLMGRIGKTQKGKFDCENCHGPGSAHVKAGGGRGVGGIISFRPNDLSRTAEQNNAICLGCHERGDRTNWRGSNHQARGLMCTNCHTIMKAVSRKYQLKTAFEPDTCFQCHKDRRAQMFRSSHMPMREGKVVCSDCHNPHGSFTEKLLRGASINEVCYKCHAEKRGPFLFEHEPVRENCLNCHDPHGSVNQYSLKLPRPRLCNECHSLMDFNAAPGGASQHHALGQACQNCHVAVHGSNSPGGSMLFR